MQTPNLPIQVNSAGPAPQAARAKPAQSDNGGQFGQALSREMDSRKSPMAPPPPARTAAPAKPQQAPQQAKAADKAPDAKGAASAKPSDKTETVASPADDSAAAAAAEAAQAAAAAPVADMLALVASFNPPAAAVTVAEDAVAAASDPLLAAGGKRARIELPVDGAPMPLPAAAKAVIAAQASAAAVPGAAAEQAATPEGVFTNMMAKADGSMPGGLKQAAQPAQEQAAPMVQAGLERAAPQRAGAEASATLPDQLKTAEALPNAGLRARDAAVEPSMMKELQVAAPAVAPLQQAALSVAHAVNGVAAGDKIPARVGTPAWDNQVAQKIVWMVGGAEQTASLTLNPPDLGPMQVVLSVTNDMASVTFSSNQMEVRQALEDALPKLREMMNENGIALGNATVNDGAADQQQQQGDGKARSHGGGAQQVAGETNGSAAEAEAKNNARPPRVGQSAGMVDTFA